MREEPVPSEQADVHFRMVKQLEAEVRHHKALNITLAEKLEKLSSSSKVTKHALYNSEALKQMESQMAQLTQDYQQKSRDLKDITIKYQALQREFDIRSDRESSSRAEIKRLSAERDE